MKTLIIYASRYGYTKDCVEVLKKMLIGEVFVANVTSETVPSIDEFDNIIIGVSIYMGQIQKKLKLYIFQNLEALINKRLALFLCCSMYENFDQTLKSVFPKELLKIAVAKESYGGELRTDKMNLVHKMITGFIKKAAVKEGKSEPMQMPQNIKKLVEIINNKN